MLIQRVSQVHHYIRANRETWKPRQQLLPGGRRRYVNIKAQAIRKLLQTDRSLLGAFLDQSIE